MEDLLQDRIDDFLLGRMSPEERSSFTRELRQDTSLEEEYQITKKISDGIADRARKKELIKTWKKKPNNNIRIVSIITSVAAILTVGFFAVDYSMTSETKPSATESSKNGSAYTYGKILQKLSEKDYETALEYIEAAIPRMQNDGLSSIESTEEEQIFMDADKYELLWLKSKALIGLDRIDDAIVILEELSTENGIHQQEIDSLIKTLE